MQRQQTLQQETGLQYNSQWAGGAPSQCRRESGAWEQMEDAWKMGGLQQSVFNNLDRIRQNTENSLHVAALCFVGNTSAHPGSSQAVLTAGFQKNKGRSSVKREGDPWQSSGTKLREQPPLTPSRDVKALCPSRTTPWETVQPGFLPVLYIPEFNRNKPLVGTLREKQFKTSRHSGEMIINQTPIQSCIFLRRAEQKKRWQIMHVCEAMYQIHLCYHCLLDTSEDEFKLPITL